MIIDKFILPSREDELDWELSGGATVNMPSPSRGVLPFGVFPKKCIESVELRRITVFCGASNTEKLLLARIVLSKLSNTNKLPTGMDSRCLEDYLRICAVKYSDASKKNALNLIHITSEDKDAFIRRKYAELDKDRNWSVPRFYEEQITPNSFVIIEDPEQGMSLAELKEFVSYVDEMSRDHGCQFMILTNSPVIMGLRHVIIYDFDDVPTVPNTWYYSSVANEHMKFYQELYNMHHSKKKEN